MVTTAWCQDINQLDSEGRRHGIWKKNHDNTKILRYEGEFRHGKEIGTFKYYQNIGNKPVLTATKTFNPDTGLAQVQFFTSTGKVISEGTMNGKLYVGEWKYYHKNASQLMTQEFYNNQGQLDGTRTVFYVNGKTAEIQTYKNGVLNGISKLMSKDGVVINEYTYADGKLNGPAKIYNQNGELTETGNFRNGLRHGTWKQYQNGQVIDETDHTVRSKNPYLKKP